MLTLLEKIEADAVARLTLPLHRTPSQELARYKTFLKIETHRLRILHRAGGDGRLICQARAAVMDALLRQLLATVKRNQGLAGPDAPFSLALVALGGYGRRELNPHSDIDIMFLHDGDISFQGQQRSTLVAMTEGVLYPLYDIGLKVGHSVRSLSDCVKIANSDMQSKTSLIEARLIVGDSGLFDSLQKTIVSKCVLGFEDEYISQRIADQAERRAKYGDSACMQEPNIKSGCGGLRDYQNLLWMTFFRYRVRSLEELLTQQMIGENEQRQLEEAYNFLLRVRNDLHYHVDRPVDVLLKGVQPALAQNFGYTDRSPMKRLERFMRIVYTHMRNVYLITRTVEQRLALRQTPKRASFFSGFFRKPVRPKPAELVDGFGFVNGEIVAGSSRVFRDQPRRLMRVFLHAQQRRAKLHPDLAQLIRNQLSLVDRSFLHDAHVQETFLELLNQRGNVAPVLRTMHEVGLLGRFLPEFGKLTCLVQHEFFHRYTADEHTLVCLDMLDEVWASPKVPFSRFTPILQKIERPFVLYLALLLHDAGKATPAKKHTNQSVLLAQRAARRLHLDAPATQTLLLLIENHLTMIEISQRRDLEDPAVARRFASQVKTAENLRLLLLHTFADSLGTSATLWTGFKEALIVTLYERTLRVLEGRADAVQADEQRRESLLAEVRRLLPRGTTEDELQAHFKLLPQRYYRINTAEEVVIDVELAHQFMRTLVTEENRALEPATAWTNVPDRGYAAVRLCTWDRAGLFSKITGSLTAAELNILTAQIFSRSDGIIFDTFYVVSARRGTLPSREEREQFESLINNALSGQLDLAKVISRQKVGRSLFPYLDGERIPTAIRFDNTSSDTHTIIDLETEDRVGLLFTVSHALSDLGLDISTARITTEKGAAVDSFYVRELDGAKLTLPERREAVEASLREVISKLDA